MPLGELIDQPAGAIRVEFTEDIVEEEDRWGAEAGAHPLMNCEPKRERQAALFALGGLSSSISGVDFKAEVITMGTYPSPNATRIIVTVLKECRTEITCEGALVVHCCAFITNWCACQCRVGPLHFVSQIIHEGFSQCDERGACRLQSLIPDLERADDLRSQATFGLFEQRVALSEYPIDRLEQPARGWF